MSPTLTSGQPVLISWNSINWAAEVMNPPKIDVSAHTDIGAGNSTRVKACKKHNFFLATLKTNE